MIKITNWANLRKLGVGTYVEVIDHKNEESDFCVIVENSEKIVIIENEYLEYYFDENFFEEFYILVYN